MFHNENQLVGNSGRVPWHKNRLIGPKPPLTLQQIWAIRMRLEMAHHVRDLALFHLAIDSQLRGCDIVKLKVHDVMHGGRAVSRATILQRKTGRAVQFELTAQQLYASRPHGAARLRRSACD